MRIERLPAVVAGAIVVAEATPEVIVAAEIATVSTEVIVADGAIVAATELAAPTVLEATLPAALEAAAPAAIESTAAVSSTSSVLTTAATVTGAAGLSTISSDSPTQNDDPQRSCVERTGGIPCMEEISMEELVQDFIMRQGYDFGSLGDCTGVSSFGRGVIDACEGAPGQSWHCDVSPHYDPISRQSKPGVS